jgi:hypothetical protein
MARYSDVMICNIGIDGVITWCFALDMGMSEAGSRS